MVLSITDQPATIKPTVTASDVRRMAANVEHMIADARFIYRWTEIGQTNQVAGSLISDLQRLQGTLTSFLDAREAVSS